MKHTTIGKVSYDAVCLHRLVTQYAHGLVVYSNVHYSSLHISKSYETHTIAKQSKLQHSHGYGDLFFFLLFQNSK